MVSLVAGIDVSDNPDQGNYRFMGIVIGTPEKINSVAKRLNFNQISKNNTNRSNITSALKFDGKKITGFCIRIDRDDIIAKFKNKKSKNKKQSKSKKNFQTYNRVLFHEIRKNIEAFAYSHNNIISDIVFECDSDCVDFLKDNGITYAYK